LWPGAITFGSSETKGRTGSSLVGSSEYNTVFLDIPIAMILRLGGMPLEVRDVLMFWAVVALSFLESGGGVKSKTMARHVGW